MIGISVLFAGAGVLSYAAYGSKIQTVVISNLPQDRKFVQVVQVSRRPRVWTRTRSSNLTDAHEGYLFLHQFLYSLAILLSTPLQLFPAVRIMENGLFTRSGKSNPQVKWQKNIFRAITVSACMVLAWVGSNDLDKFVSIIGSACCIPLCVCPVLCESEHTLTSSFGRLTRRRTPAHTVRLPTAAPPACRQPNQVGAHRRHHACRLRCHRLRLHDDDDDPGYACLFVDVALLDPLKR
jgi:hypothetical protein